MASIGKAASSPLGLEIAEANKAMEQLVLLEYAESKQDYNDSKGNK